MLKSSEHLRNFGDGIPLWLVFCWKIDFFFWKQIRTFLQRVNHCQPPFSLKQVDIEFSRRVLFYTPVPWTVPLWLIQEDVSGIVHFYCLSKEFLGGTTDVPDLVWSYPLSCDWVQWSELTIRDEKIIQRDHRTYQLREDKESQKSRHFTSEVELLGISGTLVNDNLDYNSLSYSPRTFWGTSTRNLVY